MNEERKGHDPCSNTNFEFKFTSSDHNPVVLSGIHGSINIRAKKIERSGFKHKICGTLREVN